MAKGIIKNNPTYVNKIQFFYMLCSFMKQHGIWKLFYEQSMQSKVDAESMSIGVYNYIKRYNFSRNESFSRHLLKCIDVYIDGIGSYNGIHGFFSFIPSGIGRNSDWGGFWKEYSDKWGKITEGIKFKK